jgi:PAS domain S-box-containing protein
VTGSSVFLEASDAHWRETLDAMPHKVWLVRPGGRAVYYNRAMRAFAGHVFELEDQARRERALVHPDDLDHLVAARKNAMLRNEAFELELRLKSREGTYRWHRLNIAMLWKNGQVDGWLGTGTDIDELRQAKLAAEQGAENLRLAAEAAQLGVYSFDLQTHEHVWSPDLKAIFGIAPDAPAPRDILQLVHVDDRERVRTLRRASFDPNGAGIFQDEHRVVRADGSTRWVFAKGRVSFTEGAARAPKHGVGFVLDITERKAAEVTLRQSEEQHRALVDNANDIVATLDLGFRFTSVNPAVERILGYTPQEIVGTPLSQYVPEDQLSMHREMLQRKLGGEPATQYEMQLLAKDGKQRFTLEVNSKLLFGDDGKPAAIHCIARDISERKHAEARQAVLIRELQHRTKNLLAVIQSIANTTLRRSPDLESAREALIGRLHALAHAQEFVASGSGGGAPLRQIIEAELSPFGPRTSLEGKPILVGSAFAQMFALIVHELATNAKKHGSLSSPHGRVSINWKTEGCGDEPVLRFLWVERGGPPVQASQKAGFGSQLFSLVGVPQVSYKPEGFEYAVSVQMSEVTG